jgi:Uma2 family endonuclease
MLTTRSLGMALPDVLPDEELVEDAESDAVKLYRWTRDEYEQAAEAGLFQDRRVELVDGALYDMAAQRSPHATCVRLVARALEKVFAEGHDVRSQMPLSLGPASEPEPDLAVVVGEPRDYLAHHPSTALLVVEVADSSQFHDRKRKAAVYARAGLPDYWIVNLRFDLIEVLRDPVDGVYGTRKICRRGETISPLAKPEASIAVEDLLPGHAPAS